MKYLLTAGKFCKKREKEDKILFKEFSAQIEHYKIKNAANTVLQLKEFLTNEIFNKTGTHPNDNETIKGAVEIFLNMQNTPLLDCLNVPVLGIREILEKG